MCIPQVNKSVLPSPAAPSPGEFLFHRVNNHHRSLHPVNSFFPRVNNHYRSLPPVNPFFTGGIKPKAKFLLFYYPQNLLNRQVNSQYRTLTVNEKLTPPGICHIVFSPKLVHVIDL